MKLAVGTFLSLSLGLIAILPVPITFGEEPQKCEIRTLDENKVKEISARYEQKFSETAKDTQQTQEDINKKAPRGGSLIIDSHMETRQAKFSMALPEVTMKTKNIAMDLPEMKLTTKSFKGTQPVTITGCDMRKGPDETVVEYKKCRSDIGNFDYDCSEIRTRRGKDICFPTITVENRPIDVSMDLPEIKLVRKEISLDVPEITLKQREITFDYPVFIVDTVQAKTEAVTKETEELQQKTSARNAAISHAMKKEINTLSLAPIEDGYACAEKELELAQRKSLETINQMIQSYEAGFTKAKEIKSPEAEKMFTQLLEQTKLSRDKTLKEFIDQKNKLQEEKRVALSKIK